MLPSPYRARAEACPALPLIHAGPPGANISSNPATPRYRSRAATSPTAFRSNRCWPRSIAAIRAPSPATSIACWRARRCAFRTRQRRKQSIGPMRIASSSRRVPTSPATATASRAMRLKYRPRVRRVSRLRASSPPASTTARHRAQPRIASSCRGWMQARPARMAPRRTHRLCEAHSTRPWSTRSPRKSVNCRKPKRVSRCSRRMSLICRSSCNSRTRRSPICRRATTARLRTLACRRHRLPLSLQRRFQCQHLRLRRR